jgi:hypothetical protein
MSSSSLYGNTGNVIVSAKNLTTLYNAVGGNVVTANVPERDFTTLYTNQSDIRPTTPYGNSNVEAFLNAGTDGANIVQNINAHGNITVAQNLTVSGVSSLGPSGNVHITGGSSGYVLATDGTGNLSWIDPFTGHTSPYIHFNVSATANNQQFTNSNLSSFGNSYSMSLFKNGVNIEPFFYTKVADDTIQVNILLNTGDTVDILPTSGGSGSFPAGSPSDIQFNGGTNFAANNSFTYNSASSLMSVINANITNATVGHFTVQEAGNLTIGGGSANWVLATDGSGGIRWQAQADANAHPAGSNAQVQYNSGANSFAASSDFTYNQILGELSAPVFVGNGSQLTHLTGANVTGVVANATYAVNANASLFSNIANISNISYSVSGSNVVGSVSSATTAGTVTTAAQPAITSVGNLSGLTSNGTVNFNGAGNVSLGSVANVHIAGGSANYVLQTDGSGTLSWVTPATSNSTPGGSNTQVQFNDAGVFNGSANLVFDKTTNIFTVPTVNTSSLTNIVGAVEHVVFVTGVGSSLTYDANSSSVVQATTNTTANFAINFTNLTLNTGDARSFAYINKNGLGTTYHCTSIQIAGVTQTVNWLGGVAPITGGLNDIYNITIIKTGSSTYSIFASIGSY